MLTTSILSLLVTLQTNESELKALSDRITPLISSQKEQHTASEETMTLDLKECIDDYDDLQRGLTVQLLQVCYCQQLATSESSETLLFIETLVKSYQYIYHDS